MDSLPRATLRLSTALGELYWPASVALCWRVGQQANEERVLCVAELVGREICQLCIQRRRRARMETGEEGGAEDESGEADGEGTSADIPFLLVLAVLLALCVVVIVIVRRARR